MKPGPITATSRQDDRVLVEVVVEGEWCAVVVDHPLQELLVHGVLLVADEGLLVRYLHEEQVLVAARALGVDRRAEPDRVDAADLGRPRAHLALHVRPVLVTEILREAEEHDVLEHQCSPRSVIRSAAQPARRRAGWRSGPWPASPPVTGTSRSAVRRRSARRARAAADAGARGRAPARGPACRGSR